MITETVPEATPATPDLVCWLWAAFPPRDGRLHLSRIAEALGVSRSTISRWVHDATDREFDDHTQRYLKQRAILRGRGTFLWPDLDPASIHRSNSEAANADTAAAAIAAGHHPEIWTTNGTLETHQVLEITYPAAHVAGVAVVRTQAAQRRIERTGTITRTTPAVNRYAGLQLKHQILTGQPHRCIPPRSLVPTGRTDTWRTD